MFKLVLISYTETTDKMSTSKAANKILCIYTAQTFKGRPNFIVSRSAIPQSNEIAGKAQLCTGYV